MTENEANEVYEEPTVPQYQIQLENLDFEVKKLKSNLFILEQEHTREKIRINSKLDSAKRALEKPLKDLEKSKNNDDNMKGEEINKINKEVDLALDELIWKIYSDTGYYNYVRFNAKWRIKASKFKNAVRKGKTI